MLIGLVSAKGSPGVTTAALVLAACAGPDGLMIEIDPSGGSLESWTGVSGEPGLVRVASGLRRSLDPSAVEHGAVSVPAGVSSVLAPVSGQLAESTIAAIGERLTTAMDESERIVVLDAGRWCRSQPTARRIAGCDAVAIVCQPTIGSVEAARTLFDSLDATTAALVSLLLIGERPYSAAEVAAATGLPVIGVLPWAGREVNALLLGGASRGWMRTGTARSAKSVLAALTTSSALAAQGVVA